MKIRTSLKATTAAALLLSGTSAFAATPMAGEVLAEDQTFTYQEIDESPSIDPGLVEDVAGGVVVRDLFEGLLNTDEVGNLVPGVAESYEASEDKLTWTFHLRDNAKWSNGEPVTAGDFVYAWRRAASPELASPYSWYMSLMSIVNVDAVLDGSMTPDQLGVEAVDDHTFVVHLTQPLPYFAQMVTHGTTFPVPQAVIEQHGAEWTKPGNLVGNGAYILTEHVPQERMVRERNTNYWNDANTIINKVVTLIINDEAQALTRWEAGELDRANVPTGQYPALSEQYPDEALSFPSLCTYYYNFNLREGSPAWEHDVRVRQALSLAIDRDIIVKNVTAGGQIPAYTFTPGATAGFVVPEVEAAGMTQEERNAKAQALLAEAGYGPDGEQITTTILYNTSEGHKNIAIAVSQMWKTVLGVDAQIANEEWQTFLENRNNGNFEISRAGWCGDYNEASTFLDLLTTESGYNDVKWSNARVDELMAGAKTSSDPQPAYTEVEQIMAAEVPVIPIYHYTSVFMLQSNVKGWPVGDVQQNWSSNQLYKVAE